MDLFSCYDIFPDEETKKRVMEINAIAIWSNLPVDRQGRKIVEGPRAEKAYNELKEAHIIN